MTLDVPDDAKAALRQWIVSELVLVGLLAPHMAQEDLHAGIDAIMQEYFDLTENVMPAFWDKGRLETYPYLQFIFRHRTDAAGAEVIFTAQKRLEAVGTNPEEALKTVVITLLASPTGGLVARVLLAVYGFTYRFREVSEPSKQPTMYLH